MQPRDKINKASWTTLDSSKDSVLSNLTRAVSSGQLKIEANQLPVLLQLVKSSIEEGYHKSNRNFMKVVDAALTEATADASFPELAKKNS
jgi:hypothetical protein